MKKIMILGGSVLQLPGIIRAKEMGYSTIVVDYDPNAIGFKYADTKLVISTIDVDKVLEAAIEYKPDGIMTLASDLPMRTVAKVAETLNLKAISMETAVKATDKGEMRIALENANVPIPKYEIIKTYDELKACYLKFGDKFILKPADNSGSRGVILVDNNIMLSEAFEYTKKSSRNEKILIEEYMEGPEISVETITIEGVTHVLAVTDKLTTGEPYFVEMGHSQPSRFKGKDLEKIHEVAIGAVNALKINNSPAHVEIKVTQEGPKIVELGARMGGDFITSDLVPLSTGIDMVGISIKIAMKEKVEIPQPISMASAIRYMTFEVGKIKNIEGIDLAMKIEGVKNVNFNVQVGDEITVINSSNARIGNVISQAKSAEEAVEICNQALEKIKIELFEEEKNMNIWLVCVGEPIIIDGPKTRLRRMGTFAKYLSENNCNVEFFNSNFNHYKKQKRSNNNEVIKICDNYNINLAYGMSYKKNVSIRRIINHKQTAKNIFRFMLLKDKKPDIIMTSMEPLEVSHSVVKYGEKNNIPVIVDIRDLWPQIYYEVIPKKMHRFLNLYVKKCENELRYTMSNTYGIVGLSKGFLQYGFKYCNRDIRNTDNIFPIAYPNYDYKKYESEFDKNWGKYNLDKSDFIITFLGNFGDQFDFSNIIEVSNNLTHNKKIKFVLCGTGRQLENIKKLTADNVIFPGWIEQEEISSLLCYSSIGIAPYINSINYTLNTPNKFGEYISASLPILVSVDGEMDRLLKENKCGYSYKDSNELEARILELYKDKALLCEMKSNARKLYDKKFNADIVYKDLYKYLQKTVKQYKEENKC